MQKIRFNLPEFEIENLARTVLEAMERSYLSDNKNQDEGINNYVKKQNKEKQILQSV